MSDERKITLTEKETTRRETGLPVGPHAPDPLRDVLTLRRWIRISVYTAILASEPFYYFVMGYSPPQMLAGLLVGLTIAFFAIEGAFNQMIKLRKRSAYPNVLLVEIGNGGDAATAAQHGLEVTGRLLRVPVAAVGLRGEDGNLQLKGCIGVPSERAEEILRKSAEESKKVMGSLAPMKVELQTGVPFNRVFGLAPAGIERVVFAPIIALQHSIGIMVLAADTKNSDIEDEQLVLALGVALGLSLENLRQTDELRKGQERLRRVATDAPLVMFSLDRDGAYTLVEGKALDALGVRPEQVLGRSVFDLWANRPDLTEAVKRVLDGEEVTAVTEIGGVSFEARLTPLRGADGLVAGVIGIALDVTERRRAEVALRESEERIRTIVRNVPIVLFAVDKDGNFTLSEGKGLADLGIAAGEAVGANVYDMYRDYPQIKANIKRALGGEAVTDTVELSGLFWETLYSPVRDADGAITGVIGVAGNVTERRRAEEALRESEERYRGLVENASDIVFSHDMAGTITASNSAAERILGYSLEEMTGMEVAKLVAPEYLELVQRMIAAKVERGGRTTYELEVIARDGRRVPLEISSWLVQRADSATAVHGIARDITERKQAEQALRESEERTRLVLENALDAIIGMDGKGNIITWNPQAQATFGWSRDEAVGRRLLDLIIPERERAAHTRGFKRYLKSGKGSILNRRVEMAALHRDGYEFPVELSVSASLGPDGTTFHGFIRDITDRRRAESAVRESEERFRELFDNASDIVYTHDLMGRFTSINRAAERVTGYSREEAIGMSIAAIVAPDHLQRAVEMTRRKVQEGGETTYEIDIVTKDGRRLPLEVSTRIILREGKPFGVQGIARDINERKLAEEALRESEELYRTLVETSPDAVILTRPDGVIVKANRRAALMLGYEDAGELHGKDGRALVADEGWKEIGAEVAQTEESGTVRNREYSLFRRDGTRVPVEISVSALLDSSGETAAFVGVVRDVTERKKAADALRESEEKYRDLVENSNEIIYTLDATGNVTYISPAVRQLGGYDPVEIIGKSALSFVHPDDLAQLAESFKRTIGGAPEASEYRLRAKSGGYLWVRTSSKPIYDGDRIVGLRGLIVDIDQRIKAEQALRESEDRYRELFESASDLIYTHDLDGKYMSVNRAVEQITGYTQEEVLQMRWQDVIAEDNAPRLEEVAAALGSDSGPRAFEIDVIAKDGRRIPLEVCPQLVRVDGEPVAVRGIARNIAERKRIDALQAGEKRVMEMIATGASLNAVLEALARSIEQQSNGMLCSVLLLDNNGKSLRLGAAPSLPEEYNRTVDGITIGPDAGSCGTAAHTRELVVVSDVATDARWGEFREAALAAGLRACWSLPILSTRSEVLGTFAMYYGAPRAPEKEDIELIERATHIAGIAIEREQAEEALRKSEEKYRNLVNTAQDVIYTLGMDGALTSLNPAFDAVTGWKREDWLGKNFGPLVHPDDVVLAFELFKEVVSGETPPSYELRIKKASGDYLVGEFTSTPLIEDGDVKGAFGIARDITERKKAELMIRQLAYHDGLTGLPNRALFEDRLSVALAQAHRSRQMLAVMFLDLDRFKVVNDTLGHGSGDRLLKAVADDLQSIVREGDTVARVGGDEFTVLLPGISYQQDVLDIAERILDALRGPRLIDGQEFSVTTSIGITVYPEDGANTETLLRNADTAMYRAKEKGRDNYQLYTPSMNAGVMQRLSLENDLRHALDRQELRVYYQPIADVASGKIVATEALVRWQHPERGIVCPDEFIPFAEESGLIVPIGEWVMREAMRQNGEWQKAGHPALRMTVNLSARQLQQENLVSVIADVLRESGLPPEQLQLEITEGAVMKNLEYIVAMLHQVRRMGIGISLDDFGTGYSSLSYLKRFPIDAVKIDRSFVRDIASDPNDAAIVTTVIAMARNLNLKVIAEGVETTEQLDFLRRRGCDEFQGYLISRPVEPEAVRDFFEPAKRTRAKITRLKTA